MVGLQREDGRCKSSPSRGGKAPWSADRKWSAGPRRYRVRVRISQIRNQVEPRTVLFALSRKARGVFCLASNVLYV